MISVIIPVYNVENYLGECLDSVLRQTYSDFELLLIDDGSRDTSGGICDEYARKDSRISVIHKENGGVSSARNLGLQNAKGEFVAFVDADDVIADTYLEKLHAGILEGDADVCLCRYNRMIDGKVILHEEKCLRSCVNDGGIDKFFDQFLSHYIIVLCKDDASCWQGSTCRMLFRRSSFPYLLQEDISICEDLIFVLRNFSCINRVNVLDEALYYYRINTASTTYKYRKNFLFNQQAYLREFEDIMRGLKLSDHKKTEDIIDAKRAFSVALIFWNEIRYRKQIANYKTNIEEIKNSEVYSYLTLRNGLKIQNIAMKRKYLFLWLFIKMRLYKVL